jgi:V8-like Glu-specific endopeptidase
MALAEHGSRVGGPNAIQAFDTDYMFDRRWCIRRYCLRSRNRSGRRRRRWRRFAGHHVRRHGQPRRRHVADFPRGAVGKLSKGCTGTIIAPNKVLTAAHCTGGRQPQSITFSPQFGILQSGTGPAAASVTRITERRDGTDSEQYADWAVLTLGTNLQTQLGANYQQMNVVIPPAVPFSVSLIGYHQDLFSQRPGRQSSCTMNAIADCDGETLLHNCDVDGGASGGPLYRMSGSVAQLVAVQSAHGSDSPCTPPMAVGATGRPTARPPTSRTSRLRAATA